MRSEEDLSYLPAEQRQRLGLDNTPVLFSEGRKKGRHINVSAYPTREKAIASTLGALARIIVRRLVLLLNRSFKCLMPSNPLGIYCLLSTLRYHSTSTRVYDAEAGIS